MSEEEIPQTEYIEDMFGLAVYPSDTIVYAAMSGRSCQLVEAVLLEIRAKEVNHYGKKYNVNIKVQPTGNTSRWRQHHADFDWKEKKYKDELPKPVTLQIIENVVKIKDGNNVGV